MLPGEFRWGDVPKGTVRAAFVVLLTPGFGQTSGRILRVKVFQGEELVTKSTVETFNKSVLPRRAWLYVKCSNV